MPWRYLCNCNYMDRTILRKRTGRINFAQINPVYHLDRRHSRYDVVMTNSNKSVNTTGEKREITNVSDQKRKIKPPAGIILTVRICAKFIQNLCGWVVLTQLAYGQQSRQRREMPYI